MEAGGRHTDTPTPVMQSVNTVTFTTSTPVGTLNVVGTEANGNTVIDPTCPNGRVTVFGAATNPNLNGTFCVSSAPNPQGNSFTITVGGTPTTANYTLLPARMAVAPRLTSTDQASPDVEEQLTHQLGLWGSAGIQRSEFCHVTCIRRTEAVSDAGTFMHEFGPANGLAHGAPAALVAQGVQVFQSVITN